MHCLGLHAKHGQCLLHCWSLKCFQMPFLVCSKKKKEISEFIILILVPFLIYFHNFLYNTDKQITCISVPWLTPKYYWIPYSDEKYFNIDIYQSKLIYQHSYLSWDEINKILQKGISMSCNKRWGVCNKDIHQFQGVWLNPNIQVGHSTGQISWQNAKIWLHIWIQLEWKTILKKNNIVH